MKKLKKVICAILIAAFSAPTIHADDHLFFKGDLQSGNMWTMMLNMGIAAWINNSAGDFRYDSYFTINAIHDSGSAGTSRMFGFKPHDLFVDYGTGVKVGYKSDNGGESFFNWNAYGSFHYKVSSFAINTIFNDPENRDERLMVREYDNAIHKFQIGIGASAILGSEESKVRVIVDAGLRYNIPFIYSGDLFDGAGSLNSGLSPIFSVTAAGSKHWMKKVGLQIGIWMEFGTYKLFKESKYFDSTPYKFTTAGINFTLCPWKNRF